MRLFLLICLTINFLILAQSKRAIIEQPTDEQHQESLDYVDVAGAQKMMEEECEKLKEHSTDTNPCSGEEVNRKFLFTDTNTIKMAAKAYSMFSAALGAAGVGQFTKTKAPQNAASEGGDAPQGDAPQGDAPQGDAPQGDAPQGEGAKKPEKEKVQDYCQYVPAVTEGIASFKQQSAQKNLLNAPTNQITAQKDALYKVARSHLERAENHQIQTYGWGATTACYTGYVVFGAVDLDNWMLYVRLAAAGFLTYFFHEEAKAHRNYHKQVKGIADRLPGPGDCNPITQPDCFCSKETFSESDGPLFKEYCHPGLVGMPNAPTPYRVPCVDQEMDADPECLCISEEACFPDKYFTPIDMPPFNGFKNSSLGGNVRNLARGRASPAVLRSGEGVSKAKRAMKNIDFDKVPMPDDLTPEQIEQAKAGEALGMPRPLATLLASRPLSKAAKARFYKMRNRGRGNRRFAVRSSPAKKKAWKFKNARGFSDKAKSKKDPYDLIKKLGKKKKRKKTNNNRILQFSKQARNRAQISRDKNANIFEIITHRYRVKYWKDGKAKP